MSVLRRINIDEFLDEDGGIIATGIASIWLKLRAEYRVRGVVASLNWAWLEYVKEPSHV